MVVFLYDAVMGLLSLPLSLAIRFSTLDYKEFVIPTFWDLVIIAFIAKIICFTFFKLSGGIWRFSSIPDLRLILKAVSSAVLLCAIILFFWNRLEQFPRSVFLIDWFLCLFLLGGGRFSYRVWKEEAGLYANSHDRAKALVIGAGEAGEQLVRDIFRDSHSAIEVVGFLDDNKGRHNRTIHGIEVLGSISELKEIAEREGVRHALIAIPSATNKDIRKIVELCLEANLKVKTLPALKDLVDGKVQVTALRPVNLDDLLGRDPVTLDQQELGKMLSGKIVMVTGAGGSIGSELCNQILRYNPKQLIMFEMGEYNIYKTELDLIERFPEQKIIPIVGDIRDRNRLEEAFTKFHPEIVFHAAAYKHVPMMELNPLEAVKTNVIGTRNLAELSSKYQVTKFVMISTDKAVNPTNVMGASKRIAELICQNEQTKSRTSFVVLRFGNVLGSAGSVIPRFLEQIKNGGPVTVTHPEITRFFMSIPEATQLVLQAGTLGKGGEIFVLDMGKPVKVVDLANDLIRLAGFVPNEDIEIKFTGLRPGEKLYEEVLADSENTLPTSHAQVRVAKARSCPDQFEKMLTELTSEKSEEIVRQKIQTIVPEFKPMGY